MQIIEVAEYFLVVRKWLRVRILPAIPFSESVFADKHAGDKILTEVNFRIKLGR